MGKNPSLGQKKTAQEQRKNIASWLAASTARRLAFPHIHPNMPELAEVEFYRKIWAPCCDHRIVSVEIEAAARVFRGTDPDLIVRTLTDSVFLSAHAHGKNLLFCFSTGTLGIHLGMTGALRRHSEAPLRDKHEHLVLRLPRESLTFFDPRRFGRVRFAVGRDFPGWWQSLPPSPLDAEFRADRILAAARRHRRIPLKAFLLKQEFFPGIGNWMADEILWRARLHPGRLTGTCEPETHRLLWRETRRVSRAALRTIGVDWSDPPVTWLFRHRWKPGGHCPRCGQWLHRQEIGGRTTCWCEACQPSDRPSLK